MFENPIAQKTLWLLGLASGATVLGIGTWVATRGPSQASAPPPSYTPPATQPSTDNTPAGTTTFPGGIDVSQTSGGNG